MPEKAPPVLSPGKSARIGYGPKELDAMLAGFEPPDIELVFPDDGWGSPVAGSILGAIVWRPGLYSRNGVAWASCRAWAAHSKKADITALKAAKHRLDPAVLVPAALEVSSLVRQLCGDTPALITNVPCGHSRRADCFGKALAQAVAVNLGWPFAQVFADRFLSGGSHPKQFAAAPPLEWITPDAPVSGAVVLVDDVATSGWHMEESLNALRDRGANAMGIAWISGTLQR